MKIVLDCLLTLQTQFMSVGRYNGSDASPRWKLLGERTVDSAPREEPSRLLSSPPFGEDKSKLASDSKFQRALRSRTMRGVSPFASLLMCVHISKTQVKHCNQIIFELVMSYDWN